MVMPRTSRLREKMRSGEKVITYKLNLSCPRAAEIAAMSGFDGIGICQEHVPTYLSRYGTINLICRLSKFTFKI